MLVLTRKSQEMVVVGGHSTFEPLLTVTVLEIRRDAVRLGFEAAADIPIHRWEVWQRLDNDAVPGSLVGPVIPVAP